MMENLSIKIKIGDREYPMKVRPEEEQRVRNASKQINEKLRVYREQFGIDDKEDLLAMVAFDCVVSLMKNEEQSTAIDSNTEDRLNQLEQLLTDALS